MIARPVVRGDREGLERRLAALRSARVASDAGRAASGGPGKERPTAADPVRPPIGAGDLARALAAAVGGECVESPAGTYVRVVRPSRAMPLDRASLARLPGLPPPDIPLLCLDTETTGLATAAGTVAFLVGVGTWRDERFEQVQLLLPDHSDERAFLAALRDLIPRDCWLVTYNGRAFDWPLLVARYRLARGGPPDHAGHVDLLSFVRRVFRHRLPDARLRTVERELLEVRRHADVEGWEIPGRYLAFLRGGGAEGLVEVVRHNDEDVRSLARLLVRMAAGLGDPDGRRDADPGDLAALAGAYARDRRHADTLDCLDAALDAIVERRFERRLALAISAQRARTLRRLGRHDDALAAWRALAGAGGPLAGIAWVEVAKILEHRRRDPDGALEAALAALAIADRARALGHPLPMLEADVRLRLRRLRHRVARRTAGRPPRSAAGSAARDARSADRAARGRRGPSERTGQAGCSSASATA